MKFKHRQFGFQLKSVEKDGSFAGYGSVFGNADYYRDVVMPGAFQKSLAAWAEKEALPPVLWQHNSDMPIGPFTHMSEDGKGLYVEGQLLINDVRQAKEAYALLKSKTISGMSIGYEVTADEYDGKTNVNQLTGIDLWEVSIVTFPANTDATVTQIKSILARGELPTLPDFEDFLRDAGYSRTQAKGIASHGLRSLLAQCDADEKPLDTESARVQSILALIKDHPIRLSL